MYFNEIIGNEIRNRRVERGWSMLKLASEVGATGDGTTVRAWERGANAPSAYFLCKLADAFECSVDELLGRK